MPISVLIVDDEAAICDALVMFLGARGLDARRALSPAEAIDSIAARPPDVVTLDLNFGGQISGIQALERIRRTWPQIPVIILSAFISDAAQRQATDIGAAAVLRKPVLLSRLLSEIRSVAPTDAPSRAQD